MSGFNPSLSFKTLTDKMRRSKLNKTAFTDKTRCKQQTVIFHLNLTFTRAKVRLQKFCGLFIHDRGENHNIQTKSPSLDLTFSLNNISNNN